MLVVRAALGWLLFSAFIIWAGTVGLIVGAGAQPTSRNADALIVLGAAQYNGRPSPVLHARVDRAISLYRLKRAPRLILTGGVGHGDTLSEAEVARRYAIKQGVPDSVIMVERNGVTSAESMAAAALLMHKAHLHTALLVSDSYHMLRLELLARRVGIQGYRAALPAPFKKQWRYVLRESFVFPATALVGGR